MNNIQPTISVITICFNNLDELLVTMASVDNQTITPHEHWIIDGSSTNAITFFLKANIQPSYRKWVSESDQGIADAFNKGVQRATGQIINMLNSADFYYDENTLSVVSQAFKQNENIMWLHSKYKLMRGGVWVTVGKPFEPGKLYRGMRSLSHQSMFVRKILHEKYGLYDTNLKNAMDYDLVCRISMEKFLFIEKPLVVFAPGGTSDKNYISAMKEGRKVFEKYYGHSFKLTFWQWRLRGLHYLLKSPFGGLLYKIKVWLKLENM